VTKVSEFLMATAFGVLVAAIAVGAVGMIFTSVVNEDFFMVASVLMCAASVWIAVVAIAIEDWKMRKLFAL